MNAKRIFAGGIVTICLSLAGAGTAVADAGNGNGQGWGPGLCGGPPGQTGLHAFAELIGVPPGQVVSNCNLHGHVNQGG